jgi:predicted Zn-ribbon and HTH transcriptional regulator
MRKEELNYAVQHVGTVISHTTRAMTKVTLRSFFVTTPMARKKPATAVRNHYSKDLKERVIYQAYILEKGSTEIARDLNMPLRVVQRVKEMWAEIGEVCRDRRNKGRALLMSSSNCKVKGFLSFPADILSLFFIVCACTP